jgi:hypothetical protein
MGGREARRTVEGIVDRGAYMSAAGWCAKLMYEYYDDGGAILFA